MDTSLGAARFGAPALAALLAAGCGAGGEMAAPAIAAGESAGRPHVENGEMNPSSMNGGVVRIIVPKPDGGYSGCSGQVVSRDTVLTAAHCFHSLGYYPGGWREALDVDVKLTHRDPDGNVDVLAGTDGWTAAKVYVMEKYVVLGDAGDARKWSYDLALVRTPGLLANVVKRDRAVLSRSKTVWPEWQWIYGYGFHDDEHNDTNLYRGYVAHLDWYTSSSEALYRQVEHPFTEGEANGCHMDSGGPWKMQAIDPSELSGIEFATFSNMDGGANCANAYSRAVAVAFYRDWLESAIAAGRGRCTHEDHVVLPHTGDWQIATVSTLACW